MTAKKKPDAVSSQTATAKPDPTFLTMPRLPTESEAQARAHLPLLPTIQAATTIREYSNFGEMAVDTLVEDLRKQCDMVGKGDLHRAESMLTAQAHTLDAIFCNLARRAALNMGEYMDAAETYLKLALRAQSQCRATWETLAAIKNPPNVAFVKQANIAHGPQQVNNGQAQPVARAAENSNPPTELLEHDHAQRLDTGTAGIAGAGHPIMATVGTLEGTAHSARKGRSEP